jgi:hypothetical protein
MTLVCWAIGVMAAVLTVAGGVLDALCIRDDLRLCPWRTRLIGILTAPR